jgi:hypothetical protein
MIRPQTDDYPEHLQVVAAARAAGDTDGAARALAPIVMARFEVDRRSDPSERVIASIYRRDRFRCRYCGCKVIPVQVMRLIGYLLPEGFPYHPNWKGGETHPALASRSAILDHVLAWSAGGRNDPDNLACACWVCNQVKGDLSLEQLGWELLPISQDDEWDGLTRYYRRLWELTGEPQTSEHPLWLHLYTET